MSEYIIDMSNSIYTSQDNLIHFDFSNIHEEIVRCGDCKHFNEKTYKWVNGWMRTSTTCAMFDGCYVTPDGFCAWAERREP